MSFRASKRRFYKEDVEQSDPMSTIAKPSLLILVHTYHSKLLARERSSHWTPETPQDAGLVASKQFYFLNDTEAQDIYNERVARERQAQWRPAGL